MQRVLFVAEKNDVAKGVSSILSRGDLTMRNSHSVYNKIYQLKMEVLGRSSVVAVTSVSGHLMNYEFGPEMKDWRGTNMRDLFDAPVYHNVTENMQSIARTLKEEAAKSNALVIWTDCDREGEHIGSEIVEVCRQTNPRIDVYRAKFSEITPAAVFGAVRNLTRLNERIVDAVDCRSELDLRIGAAFTRLQTLHLKQKFANLFPDAKQVISYGSCQFPTLGFVVERYKAMTEFISEPFWQLAVTHKRNGIKVDFLWERMRLFNRDVVNILYDDCREAHGAHITKVIRRPKSRFRPQPLDTVELEKLAVRKLRMSAKTAMAIAEKLYSNGWISYPRTETNKFAPDIRLDDLAQRQTDSPEWGQFASQVVAVGANPRNGTKSDEAHPPIHPLKRAKKGDLKSNDEWRLYDLVVRHFLACISWDAKGQETKADLKIGAEWFHATGLQVDDPGYLAVYPYDKWSDKVLPTYVEGEELQDYQLKIEDGQTEPPPLLTEADLITLMEQFGIGTDATHAEHIEKIKERQYVGVRGDGRFVPGYLGLALVDGYDEMGYAMSKPNLRADLEKQLVAICEGRRRKPDVLNEQREKYRRIFEQSELQVIKLSQALTRYMANNPGGQIAPPNGNGGSYGGGGGGGGGPPRGGGGGRTGRGGRGGGRGAQSSFHPGNADSSFADNKPRKGKGRGPKARNTSTSRTRVSTSNASNDSAAERKCECGLNPVQRTVNKEGPNKGRKFWTCPKPFQQPDKCNYFDWV